ncbi:MAG: ABC transporter substrate-binding protein [Candidatus Poribacteria bacterium]|nr:ABC transporter substrate-binding protein [Candidatus Poribacteria bacterium]
MMSTNRCIKVALLLMVTLMVVSLTACDQLVSILTSSDVPEVPEIGVTIGVVAPLSGQYAALYGEPILNGFELARNEINNADPSVPGIAFITADDEASVDGAKAAFKKLIADGVPVILGPGFSSQAKETFPIATENGIVAFSSTSSASGINMAGDANFRAGLITARLNPPGVMATHAALGYENVATMYDASDTYSTIGHGDLVGALMDAGVNILGTETFEGGATSFSDQLTRIKELGPEAIFVSCLSAEMDDILIEARALGIPTSVPFIIPELWNAVAAAAGAAAEGTISFNGWSIFATTPGNQAFIESYRAAYGVEPDPWAAQSYATMHILNEAGTRAGSADPMAIAEALRSISIDTILGSFSFDENGDAIYEPFVHIVKDGKLVPFDGSQMPEAMALPAGLPMDLAMYRTWTGVEIGAPSAHGVAHGQGDRTTYINQPGVNTLMDMSAETFPYGTTLVKDIMDDTNSFLWRVAVMWKTDDMMFDGHAGWRYVQYQRASASDDFVAAAGDGTDKGSNGCHGCHSAVNDPDVPGRDYVFVELPGYETADGGMSDHDDDANGHHDDMDENDISDHDDGDDSN